MTDKIASIVVTCNRNQMLQRCLQSQINGKVIPDRIYVVDNSSGDDVDQVKHENYQICREIYEKTLSTDIIYINNQFQTTGAYGFYLGVKTAVADDNDLIWIMDDDCISSSTTLERLVKAVKKTHSDFSFLSSFVKWKRTSDPFWKNIPRDAETGRDLYDLQDTMKLNKINFGTFTSMMTTKENVIKSGLPQYEFEIWGDDTEFSERLIYSTGKPAYLVAGSNIHHWTDTNDRAIWELYDAKEKRIERFYYGYRNRIVASYRRGGVKSMVGTIEREQDSLSNLKKKISQFKELEDDDKAHSNEWKRRRKLRITEMEALYHYAETGMIEGPQFRPKIHEYDEIDQDADSKISIIKMINYD